MQARVLTGGAVGEFGARADAFKNVMLSRWIELINLPTQGDSR